MGQIRKTAALQIDPETAELLRLYERELIFLEDEEGYEADTGAAGLQWFARNPGSDLLVRFLDLPREAQYRLAERHPE